MYKLFLVEDDPGIAESIQTLAKSWGFQVDTVSDFGRVVQEFLASAPHLVLMDISLPFYNGYHWCSQIRKISKVPILFLSSASDNMNIVMAMNMGADDFVSKPFDMAVLIAKVQALLRRSYDYSTTAPVIEHRGAFLNTGTAL